MKQGVILYRQQMLLFAALCASSLMSIVLCAVRVVSHRFGHIPLLGLEPLTGLDSLFLRLSLSGYSLAVASPDIGRRRPAQLLADLLPQRALYIH